eukprot:TRINITY_DN3749_c0_g1_i1.p1 TRINITY_DN3749_c0_g1~~TRINITY_DN3749_c0_g1_i1.p1  ORF type:complete len:1276 (-),score=319.31 TRINITY_DN3749_c0_g1_i1:27-3803(-)
MALAPGSGGDVHRPFLDVQGSQAPPQVGRKGTDLSAQDATASSAQELTNKETTLARHDVDLFETWNTAQKKQRPRAIRFMRPSSGSLPERAHDEAIFHHTEETQRLPGMAELRASMLVVSDYHLWDHDHVVQQAGGISKNNEQLSEEKPRTVPIQFGSMLECTIHEAMRVYAFAAVFFMPFVLGFDQVYPFRRSHVLPMLDLGLTALYGLCVLSRLLTSFISEDGVEEVDRFATVVAAVSRSPTFLLDAAAALSAPCLYVQGEIAFVALGLLRLCCCWRLRGDRQRKLLLGHALENNPIVGTSIILAIVCHLFACTWFFAQAYAEPSVWVTEAGQKEPGTLQHLLSCYIHALRDGASMLVGSGLPETTNDGHLAVTILLGAVGGLVMVYVIGRTVVRLHRSTILQDRFAEQMAVVSDACRVMHMPKDLRLRIFQYISYLSVHHMNAQSQEILNQLSTHLAGEVRIFRMRQVINESDLFRDLPPRLLFLLVSTCHEQVFSPGDIIVRKGEVGDCMYVILTGLVGVYLNPELSTCVCQLTAPSWFGEVCLLPGQNLRTAWIGTLSFVVASRMDRDKLHAVLDDSPVEKKAFLQRLAEKSGLQEFRKFLSQDSWQAGSGEIVPANESTPLMSDRDDVEQQAAGAEAGVSMSIVGSQADALRQRIGSSCRAEQKIDAMFDTVKQLERAASKKPHHNVSAAYGLQDDSEMEMQVQRQQDRMQLLQDQLQQKLQEEHRSIHDQHFNEMLRVVKTQRAPPDVRFIDQLKQVLQQQQKLQFKQLSQQMLERQLQHEQQMDTMRKKHEAQQEETNKQFLQHSEQLKQQLQQESSSQFEKLQEVQNRLGTLMQDFLQAHEQSSAPASNIEARQVQGARAVPFQTEPSELRQLQEQQKQHLEQQRKQQEQLEEIKQMLVQHVQPNNLEQQQQTDEIKQMLVQHVQQNKLEQQQQQTDDLKQFLLQHLEQAQSDQRKQMAEVRQLLLQQQGAQPPSSTEPEQLAMQLREVQQELNLQVHEQMHKQCDIQREQVQAQMQQIEQLQQLQQNLQEQLRRQEEQQKSLKHTFQQLQMQEEKQSVLSERFQDQAQGVEGQNLGLAEHLQRLESKVEGLVASMSEPSQGGIKQFLEVMLASRDEDMARALRQSAELQDGIAADVRRLQATLGTLLANSTHGQVALSPPKLNTLAATAKRASSPEIDEGRPQRSALLVRALRTGQTTRSPGKSFGTKRGDRFVGSPLLRGRGDSRSPSLPPASAASATGGTGSNETS